MQGYIVVSKEENRVAFKKVSVQTQYTVQLVCFFQQSC